MNEQAQENLLLIKNIKHGYCAKNNLAQLHSFDNTSFPTVWV